MCQENKKWLDFLRVQSTLLTWLGLHRTPQVADSADASSFFFISNASLSPFAPPSTVSFSPCTPSWMYGDVSPPKLNYNNMEQWMDRWILRATEVNNPSRPCLHCKQRGKESERGTRHECGPQFMFSAQLCG